MFLFLISDRFPSVCPIVQSFLMSGDRCPIRGRWRGDELWNGPQGDPPEPPPRMNTKLLGILGQHSTVLEMRSSNHCLCTVESVIVLSIRLHILVIPFISFILFVTFCDKSPLYPGLSLLPLVSCCIPTSDLVILLSVPNLHPNANLAIILGVPLGLPDAAACVVLSCWSGWHYMHGAAYPYLCLFSLHAWCCLPLPVPILITCMVLLIPYLCPFSYS